MLFSIDASPFAICPGSLGIPAIPCLSVQFQTVWGLTVPTPAELSLQMKSSSCLMALLCHKTQEWAQKSELCSAYTGISLETLPENGWPLVKLNK